MNPNTPMNDLHKAVRTLKKARMLPMNGTLTDEQRDEVRQLYSSHTYKFDVSDSAAAKAIGYTASVISQWKNRKYAKGDVDKVTRAVNSWIERDLRQRVSGVDVEYIPTWIAESMAALIDVAHQDRCMVALAVPSGAGKTFVLKEKAREMAGFYIYADEDDRPKLFMKRLSRIAGLRGPVTGTTGEIKQAIIDKLKATGRPIFVDEAHRLSKTVFSRMRTIHDEAGCPIIYAGTEEIIHLIDDRAGGNGQQASRTLQWNAMEHVLNAADPDGGTELGRPLFTREEVRQFLGQLKVKLTDSGFELAWALACIPGHGCLRLVKRLVRVSDRMKGNATAINQKHLLQVLSMLFGNQGRVIAASAKRHVQLTTAAA